MKRRRRPRRNPEPWKVGLWLLGGTAAAAGIGYGVYRLTLRPKQALQGGNVPYGKLPPPPQPGPEAAGAESPCGPDYPGFDKDENGVCVPTTATPAGIYVGEGCSDFVFIAGEEGPMPDYLEQMIASAALSSAPATATSADPIALATDFFDEFWAECPWPPPVDAAPRIMQLFEAIVYVIGHEIVSGGGRVYGTNAPDIVDEQIAERLNKVGLPDFDPEVVAEIEVPEIELATPAPPDVDYTKVPMFVMGTGSELFTYNRPGVGIHTIAIVPRKIYHPAVGQTVIVADWWAWLPGEILAKDNAFTSGTKSTNAEAFQAAKDAIDGYATVEASLA